MGSGYKKRAEIGRLQADVDAIVRTQRDARVREDPLWKWVAWALIAWSVLGPVAGFVLGYWGLR